MKSIARSLLLIKNVDVCRPVLVCAVRLRAFHSFDTALRPALSIRCIHTHKVFKIFKQKPHVKFSVSKVVQFWACPVLFTLSLTIHIACVRYISKKFKLFL